MLTLSHSTRYHVRRGVVAAGVLPEHLALQCSGACDVFMEFGKAALPPQQHVDGIFPGTRSTNFRFFQCNGAVNFALFPERVAAETHFEVDT